MNQLVTLVVPNKCCRGLKKVNPISEGITNEKIHHGRNGKIYQELDKSIDLVFLSNGADFQKREAPVHGKNHYCAQHHKQDVTAVID